MYRASCEELISPLAISSQEKDELIEHPESARWKDAHLHLELKRRLGPRYNNYLKATQMLETKLDKLKGKLELDNEFLVSRSFIAS